MDGVLMEGINSMPIGWKLWVFWMMAINTASIVFLKNKQARWVLAAWIPNGITMSAMAEQFGYVRLLGLSHIIWWTPLIVYLFLQRKNIDLKTLFGKWAAVLMVTIAASLVIDYIDVIRYIAGDTEEQLPSQEIEDESAPEPTALQAHNPTLRISSASYQTPASTHTHPTLFAKVSAPDTTET